MRYFFAFAATLGLLFFLLFLLVHGGNGNKPAVPQTQKTLGSYATTDAQAQLTIDGPINADQNHRATRITVGNNSVIFEQIQGYQGNVVNTQSFANNNDAYANFLLALAHSGFTRGNNSASLKDERGYCPLGNRYIFQFIQDGTDIERYWSTSCGSPGTYLGNISLTIDLFQAQVPDYAKLSQSSSQ